MGGAPTRLTRCCCCLASAAAASEYSGAAGSHYAASSGSPHRRFVSDVHSADGGAYNDAGETDAAADLHSSRAPPAYAPYAFAAAYAAEHATPSKSGGGGGGSSTRRSAPLTDDDEEDSAASAARDSFGAELDSGEGLAASNLTEAQIQVLLQQQVARLNARLNELDDELAAEEEDCEQQAEQMEKQVALLREKHAHGGQAASTAKQKAPAAS